MRWLHAVVRLAAITSAVCICLGLCGCRGGEEKTDPGYYSGKNFKRPGSDTGKGKLDKG